MKPEYPGSAMSIPSSAIHRSWETVRHNSQDSSKSFPTSPKSRREPTQHNRKLLILETKRSYDGLPFPVDTNKVHISADSPRNSAGESDEKSGNQIAPCRTQIGRNVVNRKDAARRHLMGSIYTKHNGVKRSYAFVAGEQQPTVVRLPKVVNDKQERKRQPETAEKRKSLVLKQYTNNKRMCSDVSLSDEATVVHTGAKGISRRIHRTCSQKISLPDIIMDFNVEANMAANMATSPWAHGGVSSTDASYEERTLGAPYEDYLKRPKYTANNPCKTRYRPVTPGLLESLNKLRLPSKVKTEQWIRNSQGERKDYRVGPYRVGPTDTTNPNSGHPGWIYTDT